jgi:hypothetical protein
MNKPLTHKDLARFDALDAKLLSAGLEKDEPTEHKRLAARIAREHRTTESVRAAARELVKLGEEASLAGRRGSAEALYRLAAEMMLYGADKAWPWAANCLYVMGGEPNYYDAAAEIIAPLLSEGA